MQLLDVLQTSLGPQSIHEDAASILALLQFVLALCMPAASLHCPQPQPASLAQDV